MKRQQSDVAMIGLGVMGSNLALNMADHRFDVSVWNLERSRTDEFDDAMRNSCGFSAPFGTERR